MLNRPKVMNNEDHPVHFSGIFTHSFNNPNPVKKKKVFNPDWL